ncbi:hypothetical protein T06_1867 [Trichinella sp. T6]|nr:hypothetical protein T06_1867 [Trichinella sp. T6]
MLISCQKASLATWPVCHLIFELDAAVNTITSCWVCRRIAIDLFYSRESIGASFSSFADKDAAA